MAVAALLGVAHALVDASSALVLFRDLASSPLSDTTVALWIGLYDVLAFAGQVPLGALVDRFGLHRQAAVGGLVLTGLALLLAPGVAVSAVVLVGIGNALFHLGAGAFVLATSAGRARDIGLFVGPGAVGLALGILSGPTTLPLRLPLVILLACSAAGTLHVMKPLEASHRGLSWRLATGIAWVGLGLVLLTVVSRSLLGDTLAAAARNHSVGLTLGLAFAACLGKAAGGFAGDRFGWSATALVALVAAAPLVAMAASHPLCVLVAAVLIQATMPLTVKAVHGVLPHRPALAFGLASAALLLGAAPGLTGLGALSSSTAIVAITLGSAASLVVGLRLLRT